MPTPQCVVQDLMCVKCGEPLTWKSMTEIKRLRSWRTGDHVAYLYRHTCKEIYGEPEIVAEESPR